MDAKTFIRLCEEEFAPIARKYGFRARRKWRNYYTIHFINSYVNISFIYDTQDSLVMVKLTKLVKGKLISEPGLYSENEMFCYLIEYLLKARAPELLENNKMFGFAENNEDIVCMIKYNVKLLETYAIDIFMGDMRIFNAMRDEAIHDYGNLPGFNIKSLDDI